jgi:hypothetical protein
MLEGGEASYGYFIKELKLKSELLNSKLLPVSEYNEEEDIALEAEEDTPIVGRESLLEISEILEFQRRYDRKKLSVFEGEDNSQDYLMFILEGTYHSMQDCSCSSREMGLFRNCATSSDRRSPSSIT